MNNNTKIQLSKEEKLRIRQLKKILNAKNKTIECLKVGIPKSTFYFWKKKFEITGRIEFESRKPKHNPNQITDKKLIKFVEKFYESGRGIKYIHGKIIEQFEDGKLHKIIGTSAIKGIVKRAGLYKSKNKITPSSEYDEI